MDTLRALPGVDRLLGHPRVAPWLERLARPVVVALVREALEAARRRARAGEPVPDPDALAEEVERRAAALLRPRPRPLINATGVILHTNLGRAPLSREAAEAMAHAATAYSDLEYSLEEGERGSRQVHARDLLRLLTGAEDALVVNNNASAVLLALSALAAGRPVLVSRGEAVEIGGRFRIPEVLRQSGAVLVEVGTANRTYLEDYEAALTPETALILSVHRSNFRLEGFVHSPDLRDLVALGRRHGVPVLHDLGSGSLLDTARFGLAHEPMPQESIAAGADLVCFSGDKLLGGPQAGIVVGRRDLLARMARHPLARAVRVDKATLAGLTATLLHYLKGEAEEKVPVWRMLATPPEELERRARRWASALGPPARAVAGRSAVGGGSLPGETLPTWLVALPGEAVPGGAEALARRLRTGDPPVVARIEEEQVLLDPRTVLPEEDPLLLEAVRRALGSGGT